MLEINVKKQLGKLSLAAKLSIPNQGVTALFGLSGSGKSSLIQLISGLTVPDEGSISLNGRTLVDTAKGICLAPNQRHIGYVFQDARLFPHYRVLGNLTYGMKKPDPEKLNYIVELLGIGHLLKRYPITLSGGEKQRVAIGRALLSSPEILLMDEPLSALDLPRKRELLDYLDKLSQQINIPILYVTHSLDELLRLAERVVLLDGCQVQAYDTLEKVWQSPEFAQWQPANDRSSLLALPLVAHNQQYKMSALSLGQQLLWMQQLPATVQQVRVCIYASDVSLVLTKPEKSSIRNILQGTVCAIQERDGKVDVQVKVDDYCLWASISAWSCDELQLTLGQSLYVQVKAVSVVR